jgi:hypothetical protein
VGGRRRPERSSESFVELGNPHGSRSDGVSDVQAQRETANGEGV